MYTLIFDGMESQVKKSESTIYNHNLRLLLFPPHHAFTQLSREGKHHKCNCTSIRKNLKQNSV